MSEYLPGMTTLTMNHATMNKIVQAYLEEHGGDLMADVRVDSIAYINGDFCVVLKTPERPGVLAK